VASGDMPGAAPGRLAYTPSQLREIIREWHALANGYDRDFEDADIIQMVQPPGQDAPSGFFADIVRGSGAALEHSLKQERLFCVQQAEKFQAALDAYLGVEVAEAGAFDRHDTGTVF
jgi:hypothetical protein